MIRRLLLIALPICFGLLVGAIGWSTELPAWSVPGVRLLGRIEHSGEVLGVEQGAVPQFRFLDPKTGADTRPPVETPGFPATFWNAKIMEERVRVADKSLHLFQFRDGSLVVHVPDALPLSLSNSGSLVAKRSESTVRIGSLEAPFRGFTHYHDNTHELASGPGAVRYTPDESRVLTIWNAVQPGGLAQLRVHDIASGRECSRRDLPSAWCWRFDDSGAVLGLVREQLATVGFDQTSTGTRYLVDADGANLRTDPDAPNPVTTLERSSSRNTWRYVERRRESTVTAAWERGSSMHWSLGGNIRSFAPLTLPSSWGPCETDLKFQLRLTGTDALLHQRHFVGAVNPGIHIIDGAAILVSRKTPSGLALERWEPGSRRQHAWLLAIPVGLALSVLVGRLSLRMPSPTGVEPGTAPVQSGPHRPRKT